MPVNIDQWHAGIGRFHSHLVIPKTKKKLSDPIIIFTCIFTFFYSVFLSILILKAGDIELNPGHPPPPPPSKKILIHIFLVIGMLSLAADNYSKVVALKDNSSIYKFDFICISETS